MILGINLSRQETVALLIERDGDYCRFPGCTRPFDSKDIRTIDHRKSQFAAKQAGWTYEQINALSNLQIMHRTCNSKRGHAEYNEDGTLTLPERDVKIPKAARPDICETCYSGRLLLVGEECDDCGSGPQPAAAPKAYQKAPKECSHAGQDHCWLCYLNFVPRSSALQNLITGT